MSVHLGPSDQRGRPRIHVVLYLYYNNKSKASVRRVSPLAQVPARSGCGAQVSVPLRGRAQKSAAIVAADM